MSGRAGLDLNGWRDRAARNWTILPDGDRQDATSLVEGGVFSAVVKVGQIWIGGAQAALAPHGRSPGWGTVGGSEFRLAVRKLLEPGAQPDVLALAAAIAALAKGSNHVALSVDDTPRSDELVQEALLRALRKAGAHRHLLVWRSVLVALWTIREGLIGADQTLGVVCHDRDGFAIQTLRIRREAGRSRELLAPERRSVGQLHPGGFGYAGLERAAADAVSGILSESIRPERVETARSIARLALGLPAPPEMLRTFTGDWICLNPPPAPISSRPDLPDETRQRLAKCDLVVFETLASHALGHSLHKGLEATLGRPLHLAAESAVALGALESAERQARKEPVYFDFLPQISTIVFDPATGKPRSFDLIEKNATLAAGEQYRSPRPAVLGLGVGSQTIAVHLRKESATRPRRATVDLGTGLTGVTRVDLVVEQTPLSGRARILLHLPAQARQHMVDWETAEELNQDWQSIIDTLDGPLPTIPNRLDLKCAMVGWEDSAGSPGLVTLLAVNEGRTDVDWAALANRLTQRPGGTFCISSDGELPAEVPDRARVHLDRLTQRAVEEEVLRLAHRRKEPNDRLRFLTWQFRRCPTDLVQALLPAVADPYAWRQAFPHPSHRKLVFQGVGRTASTKASEKAVFDAILVRDSSDWTWNLENACLSFLLSRSETAPLGLTRAEVERIGTAVIRDFEQCLGSEYTRFFYAPFLMVGLLRWRMVDRRAFLIDNDSLGKDFDNVLERTLPEIARVAERKPSLQRYKGILESIREELRGVGKNPELLMDIFGQKLGDDTL